MPRRQKRSGVAVSERSMTMAERFSVRCRIMALFLRLPSCEISFGGIGADTDAATLASLRAISTRLLSGIFLSSLVTREIGISRYSLSRYGLLCLEQRDGKIGRASCRERV